MASLTKSNTFAKLKEKDPTGVYAMDIIGLVTTLVSGAIGGNATGASFKNLSLGTLGNTIAGLVGGVAGGYILQGVGLLNQLGLGDATLGTMLGQAGTGLVSGGIVTAVVALIRNMMSKG